MMAKREASSLNATDFWERVFRHKKKILLTPLAVLVLAAGIIVFAPRSYRSEAKLFLQVGRESVGLDPTATTGQTINLQQNGREEEVNSALQMLGSRGVIAKAVDQVGPEYVLRGGPKGERQSHPIVQAITGTLASAVQAVRALDPITVREEAIIEVEDHLVVHADRDSSIMIAQYDTATAEGAQRVLTAILEAYQQEHLRIHLNPESRQFFLEQRDLLQQQLDQAQMNLRDAKNQMGLSSVEGRRVTLENRLQTIELSISQAAQELATAEGRVSNLLLQLERTPKRELTSRKNIPNEGADLLRDQLYALQTRAMGLKAKYKDDHPLVLAIVEQVKAAKNLVESESIQRQETVDDVNPLHRDLALELQQQENIVAGLTARLDTLGIQLLEVQRDQRRLNEFDVEIDELQRVADLARSKFFKYAENVEQARIDQALDDQRISSVSVAQDATRQDKPVSPSKLLVLLGAMTLAVGGTIGWVVVSEQLNDKIYQGEQAEELLGLPVYAEIPRGAPYDRVLSA